MNKQKYCFLLLFLFFVGPVARSQQLNNILNAMRDSFPQEKLYVHTDKNYYNPGETIWFKAYIFNGLEPSLVSRNLYAELLDENGNIISRKTMPVVSSSAASEFDIAPNFSGALLYLRAYTTLMMNNDTSFYFIKPLRVITSASRAAVKAAPSQVTLRFFAEGGDLVANLGNQVAFAATDQFGEPVSVKGVITGRNGGKAADFVSVHDGMGSLMLEPEAGVTYNAVWKDPAGLEHTTPLPAVKAEGVVLHVTDRDNRKLIVVQRSGNPSPELKTLRLLAFMNSQPVFSAKADLSADLQTSGVIPTDKFPSGIIQVTVLDQLNRPVAERISFVNNHDYEFDADSWIPVISTAKRGLNKVELLVGDTVPANMSLSITDAELNVPKANQDNIVSHLLLAGDLRGKIPNPYYYFFSTSDSVKNYIDLVMLTHGWRRYNWDAINSGKIPSPAKRETNYLAIRGTLIGIDPSRVPPGTQLNMIMQTKDSNSSFLSLPIDRKGLLYQDGYIFYDNAKLFFQVNDKKSMFEKSSVKFDNGLWHGPQLVKIDDNIRNNIIAADTVSVARNIRKTQQQLRIDAERVKKEKLLQEVVVTAKQKSPTQKLDERYASGMFSGGDAKSFDVMNDPFAKSSLSVFQYLQGKVAGLQITTNGTSEPSLSWRGGSPVFYLDEMKTDAQQLQNINMNDVALVKVFSPSSANAFSTSGGGAIVVYTRKGGDTPKDPTKGMDNIVLQGYSALKEFYSPDYSKDSPLNSLDDVRGTLYWNPFLITDSKTKRIKLQFYNNDITHKFRLVLEGINDDGRLVHVEKLIE